MQERTPGTGPLTLPGEHAWGGDSRAALRMVGKFLSGQRRRHSSKCKSSVLKRAKTLGGFLVPGGCGTRWGRSGAGGGEWPQRWTGAGSLEGALKLGDGPPPGVLRMTVLELLGR